MSDRHSGDSILTSIVALPAIAISLLPSVTCPACWPAYAALLSSVGVSVVATNARLKQKQRRKILKRPPMLPSKGDSREKEKVVEPVIPAFEDCAVEQSSLSQKISVFR